MTAAADRQALIARTRVQRFAACAVMAALPLYAAAQQATLAPPDVPANVVAPVALPAAQPASSPAGVQAQAQWAWVVEEGAKVELRGAVSRDAAGGKQGQMMYPGVDALTFLVAIATHAVITGVARNAEEQQLMDEAAMRTKHYREALETMTLRELQAMALKGRPSLSVTSAPPASGWDTIHRVDLAPVFVMAVDNRSLAAEAMVRITRAGGAPQDKPVRVVSSGPGEALSDTYWLADNGRRLKETMAQLIAETIDVAVNEPATDGEPRQKTVRYREGREERVERGYLLAERCGRAVVRSLRGVLMSLPLASATDSPSTAQCPQPMQDAANPPAPTPAPVATVAG